MKREIYIDVLRIVACIAVIMLHVSATNWYTTDVNSIQWQVFNIYDCMARFCVPVFVMISGACFLGRDNTISVRNIYCKYIKRIVIAYIFWCILYALFYWYIGNYTIEGNVFKGVLKHALDRPYHLWYLPMLVGLYIMTPIIKIIDNKKVYEYIIGLFFIFGIIRSSVSLFINNSFIDNILNDISCDMYTGYLGYYVIGSYIYKHEISKKNRVIIYILSILSLLLTISISSIYSRISGKAVGVLYEYLSITTFFESISIIIFFKYNISKIRRIENYRGIINNVSGCTFGIYLIHVLIIDLLKQKGIDTLMMNAVISVPMLTLFIFCVSLVVILSLKKIVRLKTVV